MANLFPSVSNFQSAKMTFTDIIPGILGQSGSSLTGAGLVQNLRDFLSARSPTSAASLKSIQGLQDRFQQIDQALGTVRNPLVQLFMNPQSIRVNKQVLHNKQQTRGGFVVQFWGHDLETIDVEAAVAYFQLSKEPVRAFEMLKNQVYQGRFHPSQPFVGVPFVTMLFENQILKGYFTNFNYRISADRPFYVTYAFNFVVTENLSVLVGSNLASLVSDLTKPGSTIHSAADAVSLNEEDHTLGRGWGIRLF